MNVISQIKNQEIMKSSEPEVFTLTIDLSMGKNFDKFKENFNNEILNQLENSSTNYHPCIPDWANTILISGINRSIIRLKGTTVFITISLMFFEIKKFFK